MKKLNTDVADIVAIAKEHGHEFDEEHIEAGQAHMDSLINEMSDEEQEKVAGGSSLFCTCFWAIKIQSKGTCKKSK